MHVITLALKAMIEVHNRLLHYICLPFDTVINDNYKKDNNRSAISLPRNNEHIKKLRTATAALVYYAPVTARENTKHAANLVYCNLAGHLRTFDPIPLPFLTDVLGLSFALNEVTIKKITDII